MSTSLTRLQEQFEVPGKILDWRRHFRHGLAARRHYSDNGRLDMAGLETDNNAAERTLRGPDHFGIGACVPSDHFPVGTRKTVNGSGGPACKRITGELGTSAPHFAFSITGV